MECSIQIVLVLYMARRCVGSYFIILPHDTAQLGASG
jgi:hypothetical protein